MCLLGIIWKLSLPPFANSFHSSGKDLQWSMNTETFSHSDTRASLMTGKDNESGGLARGLHGLKTEARTRPVPEIVWPDPTRPERHG